MPTKKKPLAEVASAAPAPKARKPRAKKAAPVDSETTSPVSDAMHGVTRAIDVLGLGFGRAVSSLEAMGAGLAATKDALILGLDRFQHADSPADLEASVTGIGVRPKDRFLHGAAPYKRHSAGTRSHRQWKRERAAGFA